MLVLIRAKRLLFLCLFFFSRVYRQYRTKVAVCNLSKSLKSLSAFIRKLQGHSTAALCRLLAAERLKMLKRSCLLLVTLDFWRARSWRAHFFSHSLSLFLAHPHWPTCDCLEATVTSVSPSTKVFLILFNPIWEVMSHTNGGDAVVCWRCNITSVTVL